MTDIEIKTLTGTLKEIFDIFDVDNSGTCDSAEMSNMMALMCGGSVNDKVKAAFVLFDQNNNGTMAYNELTSLIGTVFNFAKNLLENRMTDDPLNFDLESDFM